MRKKAQILVCIGMLLCLGINAQTYTQSEAREKISINDMNVKDIDRAKAGKLIYLQTKETNFVKLSDYEYQIEQLLSKHGWAYEHFETDLKDSNIDFLGETGFISKNENQRHLLKSKPGVSKTQTKSKNIALIR